MSQPVLYVYDAYGGGDLVVGLLVRLVGVYLMVNAIMVVIVLLMLVMSVVWRVVMVVDAVLAISSVSVVMIIWDGRRHLMNQICCVLGEGKGGEVQ